MKKFISCFLVLAMMTTVIIPVSAERIAIGDTNNMLFAEYIGHGEFEITENTSSGLVNNDINMVSNGDKVIVTSTEDEEIYKINENKYLTLAYDNKYLLTDKIDVCIDDYESNYSVFEEYNVSQNIRDEIRTVIDKQKTLGNNDFKIEIFAPSITQPSNVQIMADEPLGYTYYTYNYYNQTFYMRDYSVKYSNVRSDDYQVNGSTALNKAKAFVNFVVSIASNYSTTLYAYSLGQSAYQVYAATYGNVGSGSSNDIIRTALVYSWIHKETIARDLYGEYAGSGCSSYKAWLDHHETYQYYGAIGQGYLVKPYIGQELYSEHFQNPAPTAIDYGYTGYTDYFLRTTIHGRSLVLVGH